jgi:hypothetical protein
LAAEQAKEEEECRRQAELELLLMDEHALHDQAVLGKPLRAARRLRLEAPHSCCFFMRRYQTRSCVYEKNSGQSSGVSTRRTQASPQDMLSDVMPLDKSL